MEEEKKNATKLVSSALLGLDVKVVVVHDKRYVIHPPTIARLAGAGYHLADIADAETLQELITGQKDIKSACFALSQLIDGTDSHAEELSHGTPIEVVNALSEAYSLVDVQDFMKLSLLARNVGKMIANQRQSATIAY